MPIVVYFLVSKSYSMIVKSIIFSPSVVGHAGLEPATSGLKARCSTN